MRLTPGRWVVTGCSGGGKSTLCAALAEAGLATVPEVGRAVVRDALAAGSDALPWADRVAFRDAVFARSLAAFDAADPSRVTMFDRSHVEAFGYSRLIGAAVPEAWVAAADARRFDTPVFVCPPWPEIFVQDAERRHDLAFALADHAATVQAYRDQGYTLVEVPKATVSERVAFVLARISAAAEVSRRP